MKQAIKGDKMKSLLFVLVFASPFAHSALNMKPGLWGLDMKVLHNGKEFNPAAEMQKAMAKMPEAQRKKMMEMMGEKANVGVGKNGETEVCYSKKILENPESLGNQSGQKCDTKVVTQTADKVVTKFKCEDGSSGDASWTFSSPVNMTGLVNLVDPKGRASQINYKGKFIKADCGKIKPII